MGATPILLKKKRKTSPILSALTIKKGALLQQMVLESKEGVKKLVSVLVTSTPMIATGEEVIKTAETVKAIKTTEAD